MNENKQANGVTRRRFLGYSGLAGLAGLAALAGWSERKMLYEPKDEEIKIWKNKNAVYVEFRGDVFELFYKTNIEKGAGPLALISKAHENYYGGSPIANETAYRASDLFNTLKFNNPEGVVDLERIAENTPTVIIFSKRLATPTIHPLHKYLVPVHLHGSLDDYLK